MEKEEVVLITGCSSGIGRELSRVLADKGYIVVATARKVDTIKDLPASLRLPLDVTKSESIAGAVREVIARFQKIDILVNNAGYSIRGALEEISIENMKSMFDVNVFGIINMIQAVIPEMRRNGAGKIINIGSVSGKFAQPVNGAYCASKFAVEALTDTLRLELFKQNIQVTVIEPGPIKTGFFKTMDEHSCYLMTNPASCYKSLYSSDTRRREMQAYAQPQKAAETICKIIGERRLKSRYEVAVPYALSMIARFPDSLREYLMKNLR
ncbi:MAG: SDR family oxidoreductase [Clostridia bacterium]|nr:SDR family oxidoreductase [Clostridia bacterium]